MVPVISLFFVIAISILITRIAAIALTHTGLSRQAARFQARSAFTGAGFTTSESEKVVNHPLRRRIVLLLMLLGNAGLVSAVSTLILTFVNAEQAESLLLKVILLATGLALLWSIATSPWIDRHLSHLIDRGLKRYTRLDIKDYASLLHVAGDYRLAEFQVSPEDWLANRTLRELELREEGVIVLGVERPDGTYLGIPTGDTELLAGDKLILYGRTDTFQSLDERRKNIQGQKEHKKAVAEQQQLIKEEEQEDPERQHPHPK